MKKTILLGLHDRLSLKSTKMLYIASGILFLVNGFFQFLNPSHGIVGAIIGVLTISAALFYLFLAFNGFSKNSKYAPKLEIDKDAIRFKTKPFKLAEEILWKEIKSIDLQSYQLNFNLGDSQKKFSYTTTVEISRELKKAVREFAGDKNIEVLGG